MDSSNKENTEFPYGRIPCSTMAIEQEKYSEKNITFAAVPFVYFVRVENIEHRPSGVSRQHKWDT
jgi:hypothetical protein